MKKKKKSIWIFKNLPKVERPLPHRLPLGRFAPSFCPTPPPPPIEKSWLRHWRQHIKISTSTVNAGELGPYNTWLNESGFPCYCKNTSTAYQIHIDFGSCWCIIARARKPRFHWARCCMLSGPSLPRGPSSPAFTVCILKYSWPTLQPGTTPIHPRTT